MGQHSKYSFEMKLAAVTKYPKGNCSTESIARSLGTNYSAETKHNAVCDYLSGKGTLREIQKKYGIRSDKQLRNWIMKYNGHILPTDLPMDKEIPFKRHRRAY